MDKHYLTPLFAPQSIVVFAGQADDPDRLTSRARVLHQALRAQKYTGTLQFLDIPPPARWPTWRRPAPTWPSSRCRRRKWPPRWRLPGA